MIKVQFKLSNWERSFLPPCVESRRTNTKWRNSKYESRHNKYHISGLLSFSGAKLLPPYIEINAATSARITRSEEHTSELQSRGHLVCRLLLEKKNII